MGTLTPQQFSAWKEKNLAEEAARQSRERQLAAARAVPMNAPAMFIAPDASISAEQSVLGGLLLDNSARSKINGLGLAVEHFEREDHRLIYLAIGDEIDEGGRADQVTIYQRLERSGSANRAGGLVYLNELAANTPSAANIRRYAEIVCHNGKRRRIIEGLHKAIEAAERGDDAAAQAHAQLAIESARNKSAQQRPDLLEHAFWVRDAVVHTALPYVVKGIFGLGNIIVFWGQPGSGKSFVAMGMACAVGSGMPWYGRRTRRGCVLYVAAESTRVYIENRVAALRLESPALADADVLIVPLALDLLHSEHGDVDRVIATAKRVSAERGEVVLIVVDTLAVTFGGGNENAPDDMGAYVANIIRIRTETGAAILIIHHAGKDEARGMRGHTALLGAIDAEMSIEGSNEAERILKTGKVRDGDGYTDLFAFKLRRVDLGVDSDSDAVTTCVIDAAGAAGTAQARRRKAKAGLGKNQKAVLSALEAAGGHMTRIDLVENLKAQEISRNRAHEAIKALLDCAMVTLRAVAPGPAEVFLA